MDHGRRPADANDLRTGFTTGACATAAAKAAASALLGHGFPNPVAITLPKGQRAAFALVEAQLGDGWALAAVQKDAGDDPDVTHGAIIRARVSVAGGPAPHPPEADSPRDILNQWEGVVFRAGPGVGRVTKPGLPIGVGEPAINPVPRAMIAAALADLAPGVAFAVEISVPGGEDLAAKTWNPRLGIVGGISILGTTGIVKPYSCAAWIASIHRGIDVARASGVSHAAGSTGSTSEAAVQAHYGLPDHAMLDMGDFAGGLLKYLARHPIPRVTLAGGFAKLTKLAQGALDLHSARSQVDFAQLGRIAGADGPAVAEAPTAMAALEIGGAPLAAAVAVGARATAVRVLGDAPVALDVLVVDRGGRIVAAAGP